jgi:hypothetical protein
MNGKLRMGTRFKHACRLLVYQMCVIKELWQGYCFIYLIDTDLNRTEFVPKDLYLHNNKRVVLNVCRTRSVRLYIRRTCLVGLFGIARFFCLCFT